MKKKSFSIIAGISCLFLLQSCSNDDGPDIDPITPNDVANYETNTKVEEVMVDNYYWEVNSKSDKYKEIPTYFGSILNSEDKVSWISKISEINTETTYDVGFDYGANLYNDGKIYYVIYYVRPNTGAANDGLARGHMISAVNGTAITEENKLTLLKNAAKNGKVELTVLTPANGKTVKFSITATPLKNENPIYQAPETNPIITEGTNSIGYFVYNAFDKDFDQQLIEKLQSFNNKINYLVIDLRYNVGGGYEAAQTLASAIVRNRATSNAFLINEKRITKVPYNFINTSGGTTIPNLGDQLSKVYIITGQNTQGIADAFINSLRPYFDKDDLKIAGEKSVGTNITVGNADIDNIWRMYMITGKWADKNNNSTFNTTPSILADDVDRQVVTVLQPLGNPSETILAAVIADINGSVAARGLKNSSPNRMVSPSLIDKAKLYESAIEIK